MGWSLDDSYRALDASHDVNSPATVKSLARKGLIDANFDDPNGFQSRDLMEGIQTLDGARHEHSPEAPKLMIWTNELGRQALAHHGLKVFRHEPLGEENMQSLLKKFDFDALLYSFDWEIVENGNGRVYLWLGAFENDPHLNNAIANAESIGFTQDF